MLIQTADLAKGMAGRCRSSNHLLHCSIVNTLRLRHRSTVRYRGRRGYAKAFRWEGNNGTCQRGLPIVDVHVLILDGGRETLLEHRPTMQRETVGITRGCPWSSIFSVPELPENTPGHFSLFSCDVATIPTLLSSCRGYEPAERTWLPGIGQRPGKVGMMPGELVCRRHQQATRLHPLMS